MMEEIWKKYDNYIEVSTTGRVRSLDTKHEYTPHDNGRGYLSVWIKRVKNGDTIYELREYIHRLVAKVFIGEIKEGFEVNHIDFNKQNNNVENLEIVTREQNMKHNVRYNKINTKNANISTRQPVIVYDKLNRTTQEFSDIKSASMYYGFNQHRFSHILNKHNGETGRFKITRIKEKRVYE